MVPHSSTRPFRWALAAWMAGLALLPAVPAADAHSAPIDLLRNADTALADGLHIQAATNCLDVIRSATAKPAEKEAAFLRLCHAFHRAGQPAELLDALDRHPKLAATLPPSQGEAFWRATALHAQGRCSDALECLADAEKTMPPGQMPDTLLQLRSRLLLAAGDPDGAKALFRRIDAESTSPGVRSSNLLAWAEALASEGDSATALEHLERQAECGVTNAALAEGILLRARLLVENATPETPKAKALLRQLATASWAESHPYQRAMALAELANLSITPTNGVEEGVALVSNAVSIVGNDPKAWRVALRCGMALSKHPDTIHQGTALLSHVLPAHSREPESAQAQLALATAYSRLGDFPAALREYDVFLDSFHGTPLEPKARLGRAWAFFHSKAYAAAATAFHLAGEADENEAWKSDCLFFMANALFQAAQYVDAANAYSDFAKSFPASTNAPRARLYAAESLERAGRAAEAETHYLALTNSPLAADALFRVGVLREGRQDNTDAVLAYSLALEQCEEEDDARCGRILLGRGRAYCALFQFAKAAEDLQKARTFADSRREAEFLLVRAYYGQGQDEKALKACHAFLGTTNTADTVAATSPPPASDAPLPPAAENAGGAQPGRAGEPATSSANDALLQANTTLWLAKFHYNRAEYGPATETFLRMARLWPESPWADVALVWAGRSALRAADYAKAAEILSTLPETFPESAHLEEARFLQADALAELGRLEDAILLLDEIVERFPDGDWAAAALGRKGDCLFALGAADPARFDDAAAAYRQALRSPGINVAFRLQAEFKIGRCLEKSQQIDLAIKQYAEKVFWPFADDFRRGIYHDEAAQGWFVKAAFQSVDLLMAQHNQTAAEKILDRMAKSGETPGEAALPGKIEARARLERLRSNGYLSILSTKEPSR
ncbi:MAG: tetratricopeptide repeat protein [Kiritimatiellia bacterium]|jgi:TolA-binding protein